MKKFKVSKQMILRMVREDLNYTSFVAKVERMLTRDNESKIFVWFAIQFS